MPFYTEDCWGNDDSHNIKMNETAIFEQNLSRPPYRHVQILQYRALTKDI